MSADGKTKYFWLGYCVPYIFLSMNEDATRGSLWCYLITIAAFCFMTAAAIKNRSKWVLICGNVVSCSLSLILTAVFQTEKWLWYFKPFGPYSLVVTLSSALLLMQLIYFRIAAKECRKNK